MLEIRLLNLHCIEEYSLKLVKADKNHVVRLTVAESFVLRISNNWSTLLVAPIGVQNG